MNKQPKDKVNPTICENRKARHDYFVLEALEAGIVLTGPEIKSVRARHVSLEGAYVTVQGRNVTLIGCNIEPFDHGVTYIEQEPKRHRRLLMKKKEIRNFALRAKETGLTLIPMKMYMKGSRAKIMVALCKGKQTHDKRQALKAKDAAREIARESK